MSTDTSLSKDPLTYAGVVANKVVEFNTLILVAVTEPIDIVVVGVKLVPVILSTVPPLTDPLSGVILAKVGEDAI